MTTLVSHVRDADTGAILYSVIAFDDGASWVRADGTVEDVEPPAAGDAPADAAGWLAHATRSPGFLAVPDQPFEAESEQAGVRQAKADLQADLPARQSAGLDPEYPPRTEREARVQQAADNVEVDYPGFIEAFDQDGEWDDQAMLNYVAQALGPIDPDGPNGWVLRALDGQQPSDDAHVDWTARQMPAAPQGEEGTHEAAAPGS